MKKKSSKKEESSNVISPWSIFVDVYKPIYMEQNPNESKMEIYKMLKAKWESFDEDDKKVYITKALNHKRSVTRLKSIHPKNQNKQKLTISPYSIFVEEQHNELKKTNPDMSLLERTKLISAIWKGMSHIEKATYINAAKRKNRYLRKSANEEEEDGDFF